MFVSQFFAKDKGVETNRTIGSAIFVFGVYLILRMEEVQKLPYDALQRKLRKDVSNSLTFDV